MESKMKVVVVFLFFVISFFANTNEYCDKLDVDRQEQQIIIPSYKSTYKVITDGRHYFYSAPDKQCKIKGLFITKNDIVDAYKIDGDFIFVMFFTKENKSVEGWVDIRSVAATGSGVGPADNL